MTPAGLQSGFSGGSPGSKSRLLQRGERLTSFVSFGEAGLFVELKGDLNFATSRGFITGGGQGHSQVVVERRRWRAIRLAGCGFVDSDGFLQLLSSRAI